MYVRLTDVCVCVCVYICVHCCCDDQAMVAVCCEVQ